MGAITGASPTTAVAGPPDESAETEMLLSPLVLPPRTATPLGGATALPLGADQR